MKFLKYSDHLYNFNIITEFYHKNDNLIFCIDNMSIHFKDPDKNKFYLVQAFLQDPDLYILTEEDLKGA
jgi:hypothetical protein